MNIGYFLSSWIPVVAWAGLIFFLSSIPHLNSGLGVWDTILRKGAHIFEYMMLTVFLFRALHRTWKWTWQRYAMTAGTLAVLYAASDEFHQAFVPGRGPSVHDVLIDSIGVMIALVLSRSFFRVPKILLLMIAPLLFFGCGPDHAFQQVRRLEKKGKVYEAWTAYQEFAAKYPKHAAAPEALFRAGWLAQRQVKDCTMATAFYDRVTQMYPQSSPWASWAAYQKNNCPDYFPLLAGAHWTEGDSDTGGKNARIETVSRADPNGGTVPWAQGILVRTYYAGASKFKTVEVGYKKDGEDLQELGAQNDPRPKIIMKIPPVVGTRWKTKNGTQLFLYEIVDTDKTVKVAAGEFHNCVVVRSAIEGAAGAALEYFAPSVGRVMTAFMTPNGERRNTELLSFSPPADLSLEEEAAKK